MAPPTIDIALRDPRAEHPAPPRRDSKAAHSLTALAVRLQLLLIFDPHCHNLGPRKLSKGSILRNLIGSAFLFIASLCLPRPGCATCDRGPGRHGIARRQDPDRAGITLAGSVPLHHRPQSTRSHHRPTQCSDARRWKERKERRLARGLNGPPTSRCGWYLFDPAKKERVEPLLETS